MNWLESIGFAGFLFFLIKGLLWIVLFLLAYFGFVKKEKLENIKKKLSWRVKK